MLLAVCALLIGLFVVEIGLRVYAHSTEQERGVTWHADFGWAFLPNIKKRGQWWSAREAAWTNSRGWRDAETTLEPRPGVRRIVALGDSMAFGATVDYGERFSEVMEREVENLEVINLGVSAIGTDQELRILEVEGLLYKPDIVVLVALLANDLKDIANDRKGLYSKPYYRFEQERLELIEPEVDWTTKLRVSSYLAELVIRGFDRFQLADRVAEPWRDRDTAPLFVALVRRMDEVCRDAGARLLVALIQPGWYAENGRPEREEWAGSVLEEAEIAVLDTFASFTEAARQGTELYSPDGHWNAAGHVLFAGTVKEDLSRRNWLER